MPQKPRNIRSLKNSIFLYAVFAAFRKTSETEEIIKSLKEENDKSEFQRIRCPLCKWKPAASSRWFCTDVDAPEFFYGGCGTVWNAFETRGKCPGCRHQWKWTSCLRCGGWSRHENWYEKS